MSISTTDANPPTIEPNPPKAHSGLRPRRTINRLATALFGVVIAGLGQIFFYRGSLWDGLLFYGIGAIIFVVTLVQTLYPNYKFSLTNPQIANTLATRRGWRQIVGAWLMILAVAGSGFGYTLFTENDARTQAWWVYLGCIGLFIWGGLLLTPGHSFRTEFRRFVPNKNIAIALCVVLGIALFMRLYNFSQQPFGIWFDEAQAGLQARQMVQDPGYRPVFYTTINVTGHLLATYALALRWLGDTIHSMRLVSVLFGLGGVLAAYLFGRELRGPRFGLALAFFIAVARWHVNFSRVAMTGVDAPFFEFLTLFFLVRLFKRGHLRDALWAGLTLGLGLMYYTAFRLFILALVIFAVVAAIRWAPQCLSAFRQGGWRRYMAGFVIIVATGWLVVMPMVNYALNNPESFWYRTRQISILTKRDQPDLGKALWESTRQHLLMFNYLGDRNGRHNLPAEPMLDPAMGVLAVLGLGLALARTRHPANLFFVILFPAALIGGIFSVDFEAPQSLRSIAVIPAVIYFAGLAVATLGKEAEQSLRPLPRMWLTVPTALVAGYILLFNAYVYFNKQSNDFASWNAFSAPETLTGRKMAELGPDYVYILSPFLTNHPTTHFLAPDISHQIHLQVPDALPVRDPSNRPVAMFIHPDESWVFDQAKRIYPNAQFEILTGPAGEENSPGPPSVYFVGLQPTVLMSVRGVDLRYWPTAEMNDTEQFLIPPSSSRAFNINATWPQDSPIEAENFVAEWNGILYVRDYGPHSFRLITPGPALLEIDGNIILEGQGEQITGLPLAQGNHTIRVRAESAPGQAALYWQRPGQNEELIPSWALYSTPITNHGLQGTFYPNANWEGQPVLQRIDPFLDSYFHLIPMRRPYTVEWAGSLVAPQSGVYNLGLRAVQQAELFIDGRPLTTSANNQYAEIPVTLDAGLHDILIRYQDTVDRSRVHLTWIPPNGSFEPIPSEFLWPPMGSHPEPPPPPIQESTQIEPVELDYVASLGFPGSEPGQFLEPRDIATLSNGNIVVADTGNQRVQIFDSQLNYLQELTGDEFPFEEPLAVGVNSNDEIFVLDSTLQWIYRYDATGNFIDRFGGPEAKLFHPRGLTVFADDSMAVTDTGTARLVFYSSDGRQMGVIGAAGDGPGQFNEPTDVLRDRQGTYFVAEAENNRVQRLDAAGNPMNQWAILPAYAYDGPHLTTMSDGSVLMTESQSSGLFRYTSTGILIDQWNAIGPVTFLRPVGIYFDEATSRLYISDIAAHQVHVFEQRTLNEDDPFTNENDDGDD